MSICLHRFQLIPEKVYAMILVLNLLLEHLDHQSILFQRSDLVFQPSQLFSVFFFKFSRGLFFRVLTLLMEFGSGRFIVLHILLPSGDLIWIVNFTHVNLFEIKLRLNDRFVCPQILDFLSEVFFWMRFLFYLSFSFMMCLLN